MSKVLHRITQVVFLALFVVLIATGRVQLWMVVFLLSVLAALLLGRLYCGWLCPINTLTSSITGVKKKLRIKSFQTPKWMMKPWVRYGALGLFIAAFAFTMVSGKKLPVLPALLVLGVGLTLLFREELWHRYLCPYGTILSLPARFSRSTMRVDQSLCNNCAACTRVCPARAVMKTEEKHQIISKECLVCMKCATACKQDAISYRTSSVPGETISPGQAG